MPALTSETISGAVQEKLPADTVVVQCQFGKGIKEVS